MESTVEQVRRRALTPVRYAQLAIASAVSLYLIVLTGAAVRLTGSGLACESWPGCQEGAFFPAIGEHSSIEFGNRVMALLPDRALARGLALRLPHDGSRPLGSLAGRVHVPRHDRAGAARAADRSVSTCIR